MRKNFRTVKTGIIFGILLLSLFVALVPSTSAGFIPVDPLILVKYPKPEQNVVPLGRALDITLETTFTLTGPIANIVQKASLLRDAVIQIELKVIQTEEWCEASIANPLVQLPMTHTEPFPSTLTVTVTENAPAFTQGIVRISATSKVQHGILFKISEQTVEFDISFIIGYWAVVAYEPTRGNFMEIGPLDTADFEIDVENLGNGPTYVSIEILEIPEDDWSVNIKSSVILSSAVYGGEGSSEKVLLRIKPPYGFGFHNERRNFKVRFTPIYLGQSDLVGQPETLQFVVQSVGLSPGVGFEIPLIVAVVVIIFLIYYFYRQSKK